MDKQIFKETNENKNLTKTTDNVINTVKNKAPVENPQGPGFMEKDKSIRGLDAKKDYMVFVREFYIAKDAVSKYF